MTKELVEKNFKESCKMRDEFWSGVGKVDSDVLAPLINPAFTGGPRWPSMRQAFIKVRCDKTTIVASDGLSDPFDELKDGELQPFNGFGLEFYVESPGTIAQAKGTWQFDLAYQMAQNAAYTGDWQSLLNEYKYLSTELYDVRVPPEFLNEEGRVGVLVGLPNKHVPGKAKLSIEEITIVNIKLLTLRELDYVVKNGREGREKLAALFQKQPDVAVSSVSRESVI